MGWFRKSRHGAAEVPVVASDLSPAEVRVVASELSAVEALACASIDGRRLVVVATRGKGTQVRDLATGEQVSQPIDEGRCVTAVTCGTLKNGHTVVVSRREGDGTVRAWDLNTNSWSGTESRATATS
jgi:hypothetical protein